MHLNHPQTILPYPWSVEKSSSEKLVPDTKKVWELLNQRVLLHKEIVSLSFGFCFF